jgi:periplasmic protein TonB
MTREDWKGLGTSLGAHLLLLLLFALVASTPEPRMLPGMVEVEFGPFETAQPAAQAEEARATPMQTEPRPQPQPQPAQERQQSVQSPQLPTVRPQADPETVPPPTPERTQPTPEGATAAAAPSAPPSTRDEAGGRPDATEGTTSAQIAGGDAAARRAPFDVAGLENRNLVSYRLPENPGARGRSVIAVCVAHDGAIASARPAMRTATPALDNAALSAVRAWRFSPLPPAAGAEQQCGTVTFNFTLN